MTQADLVAQLRLAGVTEPVLGAFKSVDRANFVPHEKLEAAYNNTALPIKPGSSISQPYIIAYMLEKLELQSHHRCLEIGSGSGYVLALLSHLSKEVIGTEMDPNLAKIAHTRLESYKNVKLCTTNSFDINGQFDRIVVSAAARTLPKALVEKLSDDGKMIIPIGKKEQHLYLIEKNNNKIKKTKLLAVQFVPLITK